MGSLWSIGMSFKTRRLKSNQRARHRCLAHLFLFILSRRQHLDNLLVCNRGARWLEVMLWQIWLHESGPNGSTDCFRLAGSSLRHESDLEARDEPLTDTASQQPRAGRAG